jgi:hypothetical protein
VQRVKARAWWAGGFATAAVVVAGPGCSSSSSGSADAGQRGPQYYTSPEASADGEGGVEDAGPDAPTCGIPAAATISQATPSGGTATCSPQVPNGLCDSSSYRLLCEAPDPNDLLYPPISLGCQVAGSATETLWSYCCACEQGTAGADP